MTAMHERIAEPPPRIGPFAKTSQELGEEIKQKERERHFAWVRETTERYAGKREKHAHCPYHWNHWSWHTAIATWFGDKLAMAVLAGLYFGWMTTHDSPRAEPKQAQVQGEVIGPQAGDFVQSGKPIDHYDPSIDAKIAKRYLKGE